MSWGAIAVGVVGAVASYAGSESEADSQQESMEEQIKAQKQLAEQKRQWDLQDRQYRQNAVGNWAKYLDPKLIGGSSSSSSGSAATPAASSGAPTTDADGNPITDPNDPMFAANPTAAPSNALPINHPAMFQGMSPQSTSAWSFADANPDYDFFNPNPNYVQHSQQGR